VLYASLDLIIWTCGGCGAIVDVDIKHCGPTMKRGVDRGTVPVSCPICALPRTPDHPRFGEDWTQNTPEQVP
jgi:hypothetical protein